MTLVNSDPGPSVITSASAIACSVSGSGRAVRGNSRIDSIRLRLRLIRVSPTTFEPSSSTASSATSLAVAG